MWTDDEQEGKSGGANGKDVTKREGELNDATNGSGGI